MTLRLAYITMQMPVPSEMFLSLEIEHLAAAGVEIEVFCLRNPHAEHESLIQERGLTKIPVYFFPYFFSRQLWADVRYWSQKKKGILWRSVWAVLKACWRRPALGLKSLTIIPKSFSIARQIEASGSEFVHAAWGHHPAVTLYILQNLMPQLKFTVALVAYDYLLRHPIMGLIADEVDCIIAQSEASAQEIIHEWPKPKAEVRTIMYGIDLAAIEALTPPPKEAGLIVSAGRLRVEKGHQYAIEALAKIQDAVPHAHVVILGEGAYRPALEQKIAELGLQDKVRLLGHLKQADVFHIMAQAEVFVLATDADYDNLPNVVKEAMALGVPVITTPTIGIEILIQEGKTGFIMQKGDVDTLATRIQSILQNPSLSQALGQNSKIRVKETFDLRKTTQDRLELYQHLRHKSSS